VLELFGSNLQQQGRGLYVGLELLAICKGVIEAGGELLADPEETISYRRRSLDLARRLATGNAIPADQLDGAVEGTGTAATLQALFSSLVVQIPGRRVEPRWFAAHLYPFVGELVHYDAVERRGAPAIERYVFRDGGGFVYRTLRTDPDEERRVRVREALRDLVKDSGTALGRVAAALRAHDAAKADGEFVDESERTAVVDDEHSPWPELIRAGCDHIGRRAGVPRAKRIEQLLHWVPYCLARHQLSLARRALGLAEGLCPIDMTYAANPIRKRSQEALTEFRWNIVSALAQVARRQAEASGDPTAEIWRRYTGSNPTFAASPRAFFTESLAAVGALNATAGRRHFTFKPEMLEAMLAATTPPGEEPEFEAYCRSLHDELGLVIGPAEARTAGLTDDIDSESFTSNLIGFRQRLEASGLLTRYSDATDLVHGEIR
jgi:hypothetical protein